MSKESNCTFNQASQHQYLSKCECGKVIGKKLNDFSTFCDGRKYEKGQHGKETNKVHEEEKLEELEEVCYVRKSISFHPSRTAILMLKEQNRKKSLNCRFFPTIIR